MKPFEQELEQAHSILFVCSGNIIRSAFCELFARHLDLPIEIRSAGTRYRNSELWCETREALTARGVKRDTLDRFRPTHLSNLTRTSKDELVFGMTRKHLDEFQQAGHRSTGRYLLGELIGADEIADPMFAGGFEETFDQLEQCVRRLVELCARRPL